MSTVQTGTGTEGSISQSVIEAVAEAEGVESVDLVPPLYEVVDPDALEHIFAPTPVDDRMNGRVTFSYNGYDVTVRADGTVSIEE